MWIPPEDIDPVVLHAPTRKSIGVFGAVRIMDGCLVTRQESVFDAVTFQSFLCQLVRHRRKGHILVLMVDNARWHHANYLQPWLYEHRHVLHLDFLPPYSPELNPIERVWKLTRYICTHNRYFPTLEDLLTVVRRQFNLWARPNDILRKLCAIT
jgi:transposase